MESFLQNKVLMVTLFVWFMTQGIKVARGVIREKRFNFKWLIGTGGMPSSHAAGAASLATACGLHSGFHSVVFALATVFAMVTMFDAQGVRRAAGQQAGILNHILDEMYTEGRFETERLFELIGHTPLEVLAGASLGIGMTWFIYPLWG